LVGEGVEEFVERLFVFDEDDGIFGGEVVFEGVKANGIYLSVRQYQDARNELAP